MICFIKETFGKYLFVIALEKKEELESTIGFFFENLGMDIDNLQFSEISMKDFMILYKRATFSRHFVKAEWLKRLCLDVLMDDRNLSGMPIFEDKMIESNLSEKIAIQKAEKELFSPTLAKEVERIFLGKLSNQQEFSHPVHYIIKNDLEFVRNHFLDILLSSLKQNNRLETTRYFTIPIQKIILFRRLNIELLETAYRISRGGTIILDLTSILDFREQQWFTSLCQIVKKYQQDVLTIFQINEDKKSEKPLLDALNQMNFIPLTQENQTRQQVIDYGQLKAQAENRVLDASFAENLEEKSFFSPKEVYDFYDKWVGQQRRIDNYPQYVAFFEEEKEHILSSSFNQDKAYQELQDLIGLKEAKKIVDSAISKFSFQQELKKRKISTENHSMHLLFTGNPGTAKTTVARLFGQIMKEKGILKIGDLIEVGRSDLIASYVGQTAPKVKSVFNKAKGCVLFIDEAYALADTTSYSDEAISTIVQEMENLREEVIVIFAGYPKEMQQFVEKNPGLKSRIAYQIPFSDYNSDELVAIGELIAQKQGFHLTPGAKEKLREDVQVTYERDPANFGNGRTVRNLLENAIGQLAQRLTNKNLETLSDKELTTLTAADFSLPMVLTETTKNKIGFIV